jgi:hypothetical protein
MERTITTKKATLQAISPRDFGSRFRHQEFVFPNLSKSLKLTEFHKTDYQSFIA